MSNRALDRAGKGPTNEFRVVRRNGRYLAQRRHIVRRYWLFGELEERWKGCLYSIWLEAEADFSTEQGAWDAVEFHFGGEKLKADGVISERTLERK